MLVIGQVMYFRIGLVYMIGKDFDPFLEFYPFFGILIHFWNFYLIWNFDPFLFDPYLEF